MYSYSFRQQKMSLTIKLAKIRNHCYHDPQVIHYEFFIYSSSLLSCGFIFIFHLLPTVTCTTFPFTTVAATGWTGWSWQKLLIWWWNRKYQHQYPQWEYNYSCLSTSLPFPVNCRPYECWSCFCCLRYWSALPNHKCNGASSGDKCIHYNCCG